MAAARAILHVDMDAFFAAVEALDDPSLAGLPLIVGGSPEKRGVVAAASYEARKFGVHSAMPTATALKLCPRAVLLPSRGERYAEVSDRIMKILGDFTPVVEQISVDEAFLDITGTEALFGAPVETAKAIKRRILTETGLTASVGVASNKFLAKLASDLEKPDGLTVVPDDAAGFIAPLSVRRIWGIGPRTAERLLALGIDTVGKLQSFPAKELRRHLGSWALDLQTLSRGEDTREVTPDHDTKSISRETTFAEFLGDPGEIADVLLALADDVATRLRVENFSARTLTLKVRDERFTTMTRSVTLTEPTCLGETVFAEVSRLFREVDLHGRKVRLLGVGASALEGPAGSQLELIPDKRKRAAEVVDRVRGRYGPTALVRGQLLGEKRLSPRGGWEGKGKEPPDARSSRRGRGGKRRG